MHLLDVSHKKSSVHCHLSLKKHYEYPGISVQYDNMITCLCTNCYRKLFDWMSWISG